MEISDQSVQEPDKEQVSEQSPQQTVQVNQEKLKDYMERLRMEQNLPFAMLAGAAASLVGGVAWAAITIATNYQIGYMAVALGLLVGFAIRYTGKGLDQIFGIYGAILSLFGCALGNFLGVIGSYAKMEGLGYIEVLSFIDMSLVPEIMIETFSPMDVLFYGIAIYEGYKFSFRQVTDEEIMENAAA